MNKATASKAALAVLLAAWALAGVSPGLYGRGNPFESDTIESGEMLLHGFAVDRFGIGGENLHLPLATVSGALITGHSPFPGSFWRTISAAAAFLLILALGVQAGSLTLGLAGAALLLASSRLLGVNGVEHHWHGQSGHLQSFHSLLVLVSAGLCVRHACAPTRRNAALAALALGAALLFRSTMVFLPPMLALLYWAGAEPRERDRRQAAVLALAPYLFLIPWIGMNWSVHRRFILLESAEAVPNIVGGVLGSVVKNPEVDLVEFGLSEAGTFKVLAWAVPRVLAHPLDFAAGYLRRLRVVALMSPVLFLLAFLAVCRHRRRPEYRTLGLFCAYFVLIHCFMSLLDEYFEPLWPLLAVAAAGLAASARRPSWEKRAADAALDGFLACVLLLCLFVCATLVRYASETAYQDLPPKERERRLDAAIAAHPDATALHLERAMLRGGLGDSLAPEPAP